MLQLLECNVVVILLLFRCNSCKFVFVVVAVAIFCMIFAILYNIVVRKTLVKTWPQTVVISTNFYFVAMLFPFLGKFNSLGSNCSENLPLLFFILLFFLYCDFSLFFVIIFQRKIQENVLCINKREKNLTVYSWIVFYGDESKTRLF